MRTAPWRRFVNVSKHDRSRIKGGKPLIISSLEMESHWPTSQCFRQLRLAMILHITALSALEGYMRGQRTGVAGVALLLACGAAVLTPHVASASSRGVLVVDDDRSAMSRGRLHGDSAGPRCGS